MIWISHLKHNDDGDDHFLLTKLNGDIEKQYKLVILYYNYKIISLKCDKTKKIHILKTILNIKKKGDLKQKKRKERVSELHFRKIYP